MHLLAVLASAPGARGAIPQVPARNSKTVVAISKDRVVTPAVGYAVVAKIAFGARSRAPGFLVVAQDADTLPNGLPVRSG
jgi:hypothetical protein